jgi:phytoene dehydrogenase-like protein
MQSASASADGSAAFRHDTGPSLLLFPDKYREAFEDLGTSLEEQGVELARVQPAAYRVWFGGGGGSGGRNGKLGRLGERNTLDLLNDEAAMVAQLEAVEPGAAEGYRCAEAQCGALGTAVRLPPQAVVVLTAPLPSPACPCLPAHALQALPAHGAPAPQHGGALFR